MAACNKTIPETKTHPPAKRLSKCTEMRTVRAQWRLAVPLASAACQVGQSCVTTRGRLPNHAPAHPNAMARGSWPANMGHLAQHGRGLPRTVFLIACKRQGRVGSWRQRCCAPARGILASAGCPRQVTQHQSATAAEC